VPTLAFFDFLLLVPFL
jgi:hypothetical protein